MSGIFKNGNGQTSSTRVMALACVIGALVIGFVAVVAVIWNKTGDIGFNMVTLILGLACLGLTGKVVQKKLEK
jgi:nucleoside permease NupC